MMKNLILICFLLFCGAFVQAQEPIPPGFEENARKAYDKLPDSERKDYTFDNYLLNEKAEFQRLKNIEKKRMSKYTPFQSKSICGNGDFEGSIDPTEWAGAYGSISNSTQDPDWGTMTAGLLTGRQTLVTTGVDGPTGAIQMVHTGANAIRIGNTGIGSQTELVSKTFTVDAANSVIRFWYAVVFQDPNHIVINQPSFWVRVLNSSGTYVPGLVDLGMGSDKLVSSSNAFFKQKGDLRYKDWTCAEIHLGGLVNQQVTVQFITEDCAQGAHYGYAYLDDFCGSCDGSPDGSINIANSDCSKGKVCVKYDLPSVGGTTTLKLDILQNGVPITGSPLTAGPFSTSGAYCFQFDPCSIKGMNNALLGFDYVVNATFTAIGAPPKTIGSMPNGQTGGKNDDCLLNCSNKTCCPDLRNLISNSDFATNTAINSSYQFNASTAANAVKPGQYSIVNAPGAVSICKNWIAPDHTTCTNTGTVMVVNGRTCQTGKKKIWEQTIAIQQDKSYSFCGNFRNMAACCFDILPKVDVRFSVGGGSNDLLNQTINESPGCNWLLLKKQFNSYSNTSVTISIWLDESGIGDGNDLAMDDFSFNEIPQATAQNVMFGMNTASITDLGGGKFTFDITAVNPLPTNVGSCGVWYEICELDAAKNCVSSMTVSNPSVWWSLPNYNTAINFPGFDGSQPNASTLQPLPFNNSTSTPGGIFLYTKSYRIRRGVFCDCLAWKDYSIDINSTVTGRVRAVDTNTGAVLFDKQIKK